MHTAAPARFVSLISWAVSAALHTPLMGGAHDVTGGPKFKSCHHLASQRKLRCPKLKYESLEIIEFRGGPFKEKCITVALGPFESKVGYFAYYSREGGPRQVPRLSSLKHTAVYNPDNDLIWEYQTDWTRSASCDMRTFSPDVRMQTL